jgi:hypothetical protein
LFFCVDLYSWRPVLRRFSCSSSLFAARPDQSTNELRFLLGQQVPYFRFRFGVSRPDLAAVVLCSRTISCSVVLAGQFWCSRKSFYAGFLCACRITPEPRRGPVLAPKSRVLSLFWLPVLRISVLVGFSLPDSCFAPTGVCLVPQVREPRSCARVPSSPA